MDSRYEEYYNQENVKCRLIGYQKCSTTTWTFLKDRWNEESYNKYLNDFKSDKNIHKIVKVEDGIEEILLERNKEV